jgi:hypothetical protein
MGLFDFFSDKPAKEAAAARVAAQNAGYSQLSDLYGKATDALTSNTGQATSLYQPLVQSTGQGSQAYADATGANGPEGLARARANFTATPGYQEGLDMTVDQNDRRLASRGMLNSGNTLLDTTKLATDYASQKYNSYVSGLQPYLGANQSAVGGEAGLYSGLGTGLAGLYSQQGQAAQGAQTAIGNANADSALAAYNASKNIWTTGAGILQAGAQIAAGKPPASA